MLYNFNQKLWNCYESQIDELSYQIFEKKKRRKEKERKEEKNYFDELDDGIQK